MKNFFKKLSFVTFVVLSNFIPAYSQRVQYGENNFRPESLKVTFYQLGLANDDFSKVFEVLNSTSGIEVNIASPSASNDLIQNVKAEAGTYTRIYALIKNTYKVKGSSNSCYTKAGSFNQSNRSHHYDKLYIDGILQAGSNNSSDGWLAATSNISEFGEAVILEDSFGVSNDGNYDSSNQYYGPVEPSTVTSVGGTEVSEMDLYLTNSSAPFTTFTSSMDAASAPAKSTRDRALYVGILPSNFEIKDASNGVVQIYFDFSSGISFDDDCDSIKFNANDFDMSIITE